MSSILRKIVQLQTLLTEMEEDIGISDNSTIEKRVLLAIADLNDDSERVATADIMNHKLIDGFSRPTVFRALTVLETENKIEKAGPIRGFYSLSTS